MIKRIVNLHRFEVVSGRSMIHARRGGLRSVGSVALLLSFLMAVSASAFAGVTSAPAKSLTPLERGIAFYKGQTISLYSGSAGSALDLAARALAPYLAAYLHATVNVVDLGGSGNIPEGDRIAGSVPNGLTIGFFNLPSFLGFILTGTPGLNFNPAREEFIAGLGPSLAVLVAAKSSPYTNIKTIERSGVVPKEIVGTGNISAQASMLFGILGVKADLLTAYSGEPAAEAGFVRGDAPLAVISYPNIEPLVAAGQARVIATTAAVPAGTQGASYFKGVPTFAKLLATNLPKPSKKQAAQVAALDSWDGLGQALGTQTGVASDKLLALRTATAWAFKHAGLKTALLASGNSPKFYAPLTAKSEYLNVAGKGSEVACFISYTCGVDTSG